MVEPHDDSSGFCSELVRIVTCHIRSHPMDQCKSIAKPDASGSKTYIPPTSPGGRGPENCEQ